MDILLNSSFRDLDHLQEQVRAWDLDFRVLNGTGFDGELRQAAMPGTLVGYARFGNRLHQSGTTPFNHQTFAIPAHACRSFWWLGYEVDAQSVMQLGADRELCSASHEDFAVYTASIGNAHLARLSESLRVSLPTERAVTRVATEQMAKLRTLARTAVFDACRQTRIRAAEQLTTALVACCGNEEAAKRPGARARDKAIKRVIGFLEEQRGIQPDVIRLCEIAHVSERTLQYAFRERYGMSPNQFVRCWRLNEARRLLRAEDRIGDTVATLAAECGFHDPSLFAKSYRLLHGELPSSTLAALRPEAPKTGERRPGTSKPRKPKK